MASIRANCRKIVCIGRNYAEHITELNNAAPKQPFFFLKPPSSILPPGAGSVLRPKGVSLHYEIELGLVMGKQVRDLDPNDEKGALDAIDSYILAIDMTARDVQNEAKRKGLPWSIAKGFDTFLPISQRIPKFRIPDPHDAFLRLSIASGARTLAESTTRPVQADSTGLMLYRIPRQLADISRVMTLEEGDVVLTGTPKGVGEVKAGEVMTGRVEVGGEEVEEGRIEVGVEDRVHGRFEFRET